MWSGGNIKYYIDPYFVSTGEEVNIVLAMDDLASESCGAIKVERVYSDNHPVMHFKPNNPGWGCSTWWSALAGWADLYVEVFLEPSTTCTQVMRMIQHEALHGIDYYHIHQRYDRDNYIHIETSNVRDDTFCNDNVKSKCDTDGSVCTIVSNYDCDSIMHYWTEQCTIDSRYPSMTSSYCHIPTFAEWSSRSTSLSSTDLEFIRSCWGSGSC